MRPSLFQRLHRVLGHLARLVPGVSKATPLIPVDWTPTGVEKVWFEFFSAVVPDVESDVNRTIRAAMKIMEFDQVREFQALSANSCLLSARKAGSVE